MGNQERILQIEYDDISMETKKNKTFLTRFVLTFGTLRIDENPFAILY